MKRPSFTIERCKERSWTKSLHFLEKSLLIERSVSLASERALYKFQFRRRSVDKIWQAPLGSCHASIFRISNVPFVTFVPFRHFPSGNESFRCNNAINESYLPLCWCHNVGIAWVVDITLAATTVLPAKLFIVLEQRGGSSSGYNRTCASKKSLSCFRIFRPYLPWEVRKILAHT